MLIPLIKLDNNKGFFTIPMTILHIMLPYIIGKHQIIAHGMEEEYVHEDTTAHINGIE